MRITLFSIVLIVPLSLAYAGYKVSRQISLGSNWASGSLAAARSSPDSLQNIGCIATGYPTYEMVTCSARNSSGTYLGCWSQNSYLVEAARAITPASELYFEMNNTTGECTRISTYSYSFVPPMVP